MPRDLRLKITKRLVDFPKVSFARDLIYLPEKLMQDHALHIGDPLLAKNPASHHLLYLRAWPTTGVLRANECILFDYQLAGLALALESEVQIYPLEKNLKALRPACIRVGFADLKTTRRLFTTLKRNIMDAYIRAALAGRAVYPQMRFEIEHRGRCCLLKITQIEYSDSTSIGGTLKEALSSLSLKDNDGLKGDNSSFLLDRLVYLDPAHTKIDLPCVSLTRPIVAEQHNIEPPSVIDLESAAKDPARGENPAPLCDVGGLDQQIDAIRAFVEKPLLHPEFFERYGLKPPCGLLLHGPPGTGKTLIAQTIADRLHVPFFSIDSASILSEYVGESEAKLKQVFDEARRQAPSVIFIDEIDAMCPKRDEYSRASDNRIVATFLTLMDGIVLGDPSQGAKHTVVMGTTNRINSIDPALRRPGRFDKEIEIGVPNAAQRTDILSKLIKRTRAEISPTEIERLASLCHGYVGADLAAVVKEAGLLAIQDHLASTALIVAHQQKPLTFNPMQAVDADQLVITKQHFFKAQGLVSPSAMRELIIDIPKVPWTAIGGNRATIKELQEAISWPIQYEAEFLKMNIKPSKGVLLYGPPGCSKTLMAKAIATESGLNFISIKGPEIFSKWVGESEKAIRNIFKKARQVAPCILFFDEIDALAGRRGQGGGVTDRVLTQLLVELDGAVELKNVTVLAATNLPFSIDPALLRAGRLDRHLYVPLPDKESRSAIFKVYLSKIPLDFELDQHALDEFANLSLHFTGAEIETVSREAALNALREDLATTRVKRHHCIAAITSFSPRTDLKALEMYARFSKV